MIDELVEDLLLTGRDITDSELHDLRRVVAAAGFSPDAVTRAGPKLSGMVWGTRSLRSNDWVPNDIQHYLLHVVVHQEWPVGTSLDEYVESLRDAVLREDGPVALDERFGVHRLSMYGRSGRWRGPFGSEWIMVGYNIGYGYWATGFQPDVEHFRVQQREGTGRRWLRPMM